MQILPAIDLRDGKVVRLQRGDYDRQTTYSLDPVAVAEDFVRAGAEWIHMVDLDAARSGRPTNTAAVRAVRQAVDARIELGGGARDRRTIDSLLDAGADRVVLGSAALRDWAWFEGLLQEPLLSGRLVLGLDARDGKLATDGWTRQIDATAPELAARVKGSALAAIVHTDIGRDSMLTGVNLDATAEVIAATDVPVIASGGVGSIDDVAGCKRIGCGGMIVGKAYYEGKIDLAEAVRRAKE